MWFLQASWGWWIKYKIKIKIKIQTYTKYFLRCRVDSSNNSFLFSLLVHKIISTTTTKTKLFPCFPSFHKIRLRLKSREACQQGSLNVRSLGTRRRHLQRLPLQILRLFQNNNNKTTMMICHFFLIKTKINKMLLYPIIFPITIL